MVKDSFLGPSPTVKRLGVRAGFAHGRRPWPQENVNRYVMQQSVTRRAALLAALVPGLLDEAQPLRGTCPTCVGAVDGTLGSCAGLQSCLSSFDDRPGHFVAPWAYDIERREDAVRTLVRAVKSLGGTVRHVEDTVSYGYVYATWSGWSGTDDVEFLLPDGDNTVALRAAARVQGVPDLGRNERRLEQLRAELGWEVVPILRNRKRALFFVESPWDSFGPVPPTDAEYRFGTDLDQEQ